jgi:hypothetical protein
MASTNLPNLRVITDQLRVDNNAVGEQSEAFLVGSASAPDVQDPSSGPDDTPADADGTKPDVFPFMRAYGCLGRKSDQNK